MNRARICNRYVAWQYVVSLLCLRRTLHQKEMNHFNVTYESGLLFGYEQKRFFIVCFNKTEKQFVSPETFVSAEDLR